MLYLLDSNDPLNSPSDRGITGELYGGDAELRLQQELALGAGGWRLIEALGRPVDACHLNEGHAAFAILDRARSFMRAQRLTFEEALWATRAGNVFTTHTPAAATICEWNIEAGECTKTLTGHTGYVFSIVIHNNRLYSASYDNTICEWNIEAGECTKTFTKHTNCINSIVFHNNRLYSASGDKTIREYSLD